MRDTVSLIRMGHTVFVYFSLKGVVKQIVVRFTLSVETRKI